MADDPNRDIWPVREGSLCVDTCRSSIDPRERHIVCKLDRCQLEDRYLRLLEEANNLKKLSNSQEDKIKRLATKLMRVSANPRTCPGVINVYEDKNRIIALEAENSKLKDKISVLRNQLLNHTIAGRSSSRSRHPQTRPSSGRITCRSENSRMKIIPSCHCIAQTGSEDSNVQISIEKIQELEAQKEEMTDRISELEKELSSCSLINQKQKVAENVEYIKVWRQMKLLNDKLLVTEAENESLHARINDLTRMLEEKTKSNEEITTELLAEKTRIVQMDEKALTAKESELSLREKDEQIKDLMNEIKILQQHNTELIELSNKYGEIELENKELKKKISQQFNDQECLKTALSTEKTNITLQSSNDHLIGKLEELQKNIDTLTIQLSSFQTQTEKQEASAATQATTKVTNINIPIIAGKPEQYSEIATQVEQCGQCCKKIQDTLQVDIADKLESCKLCTDDVAREAKKSPRLTEKAIQTDSPVKKISIKTKDQGTSIMTPVKEKSKKEEPPVVVQRPESTSTPQTPLTPEKMLKLLHQAEISPTTRLAQIKMDGCNVSEQNQRHSRTEPIAQVAQENAPFHTISNPYKQQQTSTGPNPSETLDNQVTDRNRILTALFNMLQEQPPPNTMPSEDSALYRPIPPIKSKLTTDLNNNDIDTTTDPFRSGCSTRKSCSALHAKQHQDKWKRRLFTGVKKYNRTLKFANSNTCTCSDLAKCSQDAKCDNHCCQSANVDLHSAGRLIRDESDPTKDSIIPMQSDPTKVSSSKSLIRNLGSTFISRELQDETKTFDSWEKHQGPQKMCKNEESLDEYIKHLNKCRELVNGATGIPVKEIVEHAKFTESPLCRIFHPEAQKVESHCSVDCPNDCIEIASSPSGSFPLVIADGQGLLELHIVSLQLSNSAKQILFREKDVGNVSLFVSWDMWNQETAYTPTLKSPKLNFNSSFVYRIPDLFSFFNFVLLDFVIFQVNVFHEDDGSYVVAKGKLCIKDILDYPQNKLYYIAPVNSVIPCSVGANFGQLSLWVRLSCDVEKVAAFTKKRRSQWETTMKSVSNLLESEDATVVSKEELLVLKDGSSEPLNYETSKDNLFKESDSKQFTDKSSDAEEVKTLAVQIVPDANLLTVVRESEDDTDLSEETKVMVTHRKSFYGDSTRDETSDGTDSSLMVSSKMKHVADAAKKRSDMLSRVSSHTEFTTAMSTEQDSDVTRGTSSDSIDEVNRVLSDKNWEKYKHRSSVTFHAAGIDSEAVSEIEALAEAPLDKDTILIEIVNMILLPKSSVMQNDDYQLLYIEYSFLGYCGADMETQSVQKPKPPNQKLTYNFKRKFRVDEAKHMLQNNILRAMLDDTTNPNIKFVVVCEPLPEETDVKECVELGFANFNIREYALGNSDRIVSLPIYSPDEKEQIGLLKICVLGRDTIRQYLGKRESNL